MRRHLAFGLLALVPMLLAPLCAPRPSPNCGNGTIEVPETCDDGNVRTWDGCSRVCRVEVIPGGHWTCLGEPSECSLTLTVASTVLWEGQPDTGCITLWADEAQFRILWRTCDPWRNLCRKPDKPSCLVGFLPGVGTLGDVDAFTGAEICAQRAAHGLPCSPEYKPTCRYAFGASREFGLTILEDCGGSSAPTVAEASP